MSNCLLFKGNNSKCDCDIHKRREINEETNVDDVSKLFNSVLNISNKLQERPCQAKNFKQHNDIIAINSEIHETIIGSHCSKLKFSDKISDKSGKKKTRKRNKKLAQESVSSQFNEDLLQLHPIVKNSKSIPKNSPLSSQNVVSPNRCDAVKRSKTRNEWKRKSKRITECKARLQIESNREFKLRKDSSTTLDSQSCGRIPSLVFQNTNYIEIIEGQPSTSQLSKVHQRRKEKSQRKKKEDENFSRKITCDQSNVLDELKKKSHERIKKKSLEKKLKSDLNLPITQSSSVLEIIQDHAEVLKKDNKYNYSWKKRKIVRRNSCEIPETIQSKLIVNDKREEKKRGKNVKELEILKDNSNLNLKLKSKKKLEANKQEKLKLKDEAEEIDNSAEDNKTKKRKEKEKFPKTIKQKIIRRILKYQSSDNQIYIEGNIRINIKFPKHAYLSIPGGAMDILIVGVSNRNRALEGDLVVALINPEEQWFTHPTGEVQKTGVVVTILEKVHPRKAIGFIKLKKKGSVIFQARDPRIPLMNINSESIPPAFYTNPESFENVLYLSEISKWKYPRYAFGKLKETVGCAGDLKVETNAILLENDLDVRPFENSLTQELPPIDYTPTPIDFEGREDWRSHCIFTIDPETAVDLDDAVSCSALPNGNFEIGVHISDVTHYLEAFTPLDNKVAERATTVYLVDNVYHMLPKQLCQVCSLIPGQDKLAFSVIWEMTPKAEVVTHRFIKTVINSCCQMSYQQAQLMIDNTFHDWSNDSSLIIEGEFKYFQLCQIVQNLHKLASLMRKKRFDNGALKIDQPKLYIKLDKETGIPISCIVEERKESNELIEEFMLLANMTVARRLYETLPETALLRSHKEPSTRVLRQTREMLEKLGVILNIDSAGSLQQSISQYQYEISAESNESIAAKCRMMVINTLCARSMTRAIYRCSTSAKEVKSLKHYALNVPLYTHFTSPIRRYPDCIVHRLLYASIQNNSLHPKWNSSLCKKLASNCNVKKYSAKVAQEQSNELFFTYLLNLKGPMDIEAVIMDVKNKSIDVIIVDLGLKVRVYFSDMEEEVRAEFLLDNSVPTVNLTWIKSEVKQVLNVFSIINVRIQKHPFLFRLHGVLLPPDNLNG